MTLLTDAQKVIFHGHNVTAERSDSGWVVTKWEQGLPVARRPVSQEQLTHFMVQTHHSII